MHNLFSQVETSRGSRERVSSLFSPRFYFQLNNVALAEICLRGGCESWLEATSDVS